MSIPFLRLVADDLLTTFGHDLRRVTIVFPSRRARLFFTPMLKSFDRPVWAPRFTDMSSLLQSLSPYSLLDSTEAICMLYGVYRTHVADAETLDEFFSWGHVLLSDFDDIDKHLVSARQLFANMTELQRMDSLDFLTPEQIETLTHFFANFSVSANTELKKRFLRLWERMSDIYTSWHKLMLANRSMTEGAMFRDVVESNRLDTLLEGDTIYAFVGLNALNAVEEKMMRKLQRAGRARFYWDYDTSYIQNPHAEAGLFMRQNLEKFPSSLPAKHFNNLATHLTDFTFVAASGENIQARYVASWVKTLPHPTSTANAVVLCDEALLHPVLHAIPDAANGGPEVANITMGYPVKQTAVCSYLIALLAMQVDGWDEAHHRFLSHYRRIVEHHPLFHDSPFEHQADALALLAYLNMQIIGIKTDDELNRETIFRLHTTLNRLHAMVSKGTLTVSVLTLQSIIQQAVSLISVPFHGEPAEGMQIMGVLETRCLDFDNILLLSVGEGHMPSSPHTSSFIPYHLRGPFGLTTLEHRVAIQAYHFYRLVQRATHITCVYNTASTDGTKNEMSRFLRQLLADTDTPIRTLMLAPKIQLQRATEPIKAEKTPHVMELLRQNVKRIAPTTLNTYLQCPFRFYLNKVVGIKEPDTPSEGSIDAATFGTIFHDAAQTVYERIGHPHIIATDLEPFVGKDGKKTPLSDALLMSIVTEMFDKDYFQVIGDPHQRYTGQMLIQRDVIVRYLQLLLLHDYRHTPFDILKLEEWSETPITLHDGTIVMTGGKIDRMDSIMVDEKPVVRIVDYKTGRYDENKLRVSDMDTLFSEGGYAFQTFVYCMATCEQDEKRPVIPALYFIQQGANPDYDPILTFGENKEKIADFHDLCHDMRSRMTALLEEIFDPTIPFVAAEAGSTACTYCPFTHICGI